MPSRGVVTSDARDTLFTDPIPGWLSYENESVETDIHRDSESYETERLQVYRLRDIQTGEREEALSMVVVVKIQGKVRFYPESRFYVMTPLGWECRICQDSVRFLSIHLLRCHEDKLREVIKRRK